MSTDEKKDPLEGLWERSKTPGARSLDPTKVRAHITDLTKRTEKAEERLELMEASKSHYVRENIDLTERLEKAETELAEARGEIDVWRSDFRARSRGSRLAESEGREPDAWINHTARGVIEELKIADRIDIFKSDVPRRVGIHIGTPPPERDEGRVEITDEAVYALQGAIRRNRDIHGRVHTLYRDVETMLRAALPHLTSPSEPEGERVTFDGCGHTISEARAGFKSTGSNVPGCCPDCASDAGEGDPIRSSGPMIVCDLCGSKRCVNVGGENPCPVVDAGEDEPETGDEDDATRGDVPGGDDVAGDDRVGGPGSGHPDRVAPPVSGPVPEGGEELPIPVGTPNGIICEECGTEGIDCCSKCGAPQCCPKCCAEVPVPNRREPWRTGPDFGGVVAAIESRLDALEAVAHEPTSIPIGNIMARLKKLEEKEAERFTTPPEAPESTVDRKDPWAITGEDKHFAARCAGPELNLGAAFRCFRDRLRDRIAPEITRLRAEVERLRRGLERIKSHRSNNSYIPSEIELIADDALNPQPEENTDK